MSEVRANNILNLVLLRLIMLSLTLNACTTAVDATPPESLPEDIPGESILPSPEAPATSTHTPTADPAVLIEEATLFKADFDSGIDSGINGPLNQWETRQGAEDNIIFCNIPGDDGTSLTFGSSDWSNYVVEVDVQIINDNPEIGIEIFVRYGEGGEGYRATIYNNWAAMNFYPPFIDFGGATVSIEDGGWHTLRVEVVNETFSYFVDDELIITFEDEVRATGLGGIGITSGTEVCVDNLRMWAIDENGPIARENVPGVTDPNDPLAKYESSDFDFVNGSEPDMPIWDSKRQGYTHQSDDTREQLVLDETYSVDSGEEIVFNDKIIWLRPNRRGDIEVYGTLIIRDSLLLWDQTEHQQTQLSIKKGGTLIIESSYVFSANQYWVNWLYDDGSTILLDNFVGNPWTGIQGSVNYTSMNYSTVSLTFLEGTHDSRIDISSAHHVWFEIFPPAGEYVITLPAKREWVDWEISDIWPNTTVTVNNSYLYERDISLSYGTHVTVKDVPTGFGLGWSIGSGAGIFECELRGLGDPDHDEGVFYEYMVWEIPCNDSSLTVENSLLQRAWPVIWGDVNLRIFDSNLVDPRNYGSGAVMEIYNSTIDNIAAYDGGKVYLENSRIRYDIEAKDTNSVIYGYNISPRDFDTQIEIIEVDGGRYIEMENLGPPWD